MRQPQALCTVFAPRNGHPQIGDEPNMEIPMRLCEEVTSDVHDGAHREEPRGDGGSSL